MVGKMTSQEKDAELAKAMIRSAGESWQLGRRVTPSLLYGEKNCHITARRHRRRENGRYSHNNERSCCIPEVFEGMPNEC